MLLLQTLHRLCSTEELLQTALQLNALHRLNVPPP